MLLSNEMVDSFEPLQTILLALLAFTVIGTEGTWDTWSRSTCILL